MIIPFYFKFKVSKLICMYIEKYINTRDIVQSNATRNNKLFVLYHEK